MPLQSISPDGSTIVDPSWDTQKYLTNQLPSQNNSNLGGSSNPWQFNVTSSSYGAKGNGKAVSDGAITTGTSTLACTTSRPFSSTATDGGKAILIMGAGVSGAPLLTTISSVTDSGHAVLATTASTTVTSNGVIFGTDDTAAIKAALAAAFSYAQANAHYAEVIFPPQLYILSSAPTIGGVTQGNAIIPLPVVTATSSPKITLSFTGMQSDSAALIHWLQPTVQTTGAVLACLRLDGTNDATYGPASVIGGPFHGYGGVTSTFSNMCPIINNLSVLVPFNSTYSGFDFYGCAEAYIPNAAVLPLGTVASGTGWPQISSASITNAPQFGLRIHCHTVYHQMAGMMRVVNVK